VPNTIAQVTRDSRSRRHMTVISACSTRVPPARRRTSPG